MRKVTNVHIGGVNYKNKTIYTTTVFPSVQSVIRQLNVWLFDHLHAKKEEMKQLPPLDDWSWSDEDASMWYIKYPSDDYLIWTRREPED